MGMSNLSLPIAGKVFETVQDKTGSPLPIAAKLAELLKQKGDKKTSEIPISMQSQPQGGMTGVANAPNQIKTGM